LNHFRKLIGILVSDPFCIQELIINLKSLDPLDCPWLGALRVDFGVELVVFDGHVPDFLSKVRELAMDKIHCLRSHQGIRLNIFLSGMEWCKRKT
jgi:hypothetical protein